MFLVGAIIGFLAAESFSEEAKKKKSDRSAYYEEYYRNISPSTFYVEKNGNKITITVR
jgi:hypothetical protein